MLPIIAVGFGGFFGAICRFYVSQWLGTVDSFPIATLLTNWVGSLLLAFILATVSKRLSPIWKLAVTTGFLGAFTTFSTFSVEVVRLFDSGEVILAVVYVGASVIGGLCMSFLGYTLAKGGQR